MKLSHAHPLGATRPVDARWPERRSAPELLEERSIDLVGAAHDVVLPFAPARRALPRVVAIRETRSGGGLAQASTASGRSTLFTAVRATTPTDRHGPHLRPLVLPRQLA